MNAKSWKEWACIAGIVNGIESVALTTIAMFFYTGGSIFNNTEAHYDFFNNFFSDLGRPSGFAGQNNLVPSTLFILTFCISAVCVFLFSLAFPGVFATNPKGRRLAIISSICGIISTPFLFAIGFVPEGSPNNAHTLLSGIALLFAGIEIFIATAAIWKVTEYPRAIAWVGIFAWCFGWCFVVTGLILGASTPPLLMLNVTMQKIVEYTLCLWSIMIGWITLRVYKRANN